MYAQDRPKIALVLSGGGARGGAHVGVLKVLEEKRIPIDLIVGTSMGAFVGGLYAAGKTPEQIENMLVNTDWKQYIRTDLVRKETTMRKKEIESRYHGKIGFGVNANDDIVLPTGVFNRQPMLQKYEEETRNVVNITDFDELFIPFRAVATNIKNGESVVLGSGSLAKSIYASTAIPGGFQPININGLDLVDGGVSDNIPIGVAKKMGADIIIAVDVSENFDKDIDVSSYLTVLGQLMNILMRKNANESIATLRDKDILLTPDLKGYSGLDADKYKEIIQTGVDIAQKEYDSKLKHLSLSEKDYLAYYNEQKLQLKNQDITIDKVVIKNPTYVNDEMIRSRLSIKSGQKFDDVQLRKDMLDIYNLGIFDQIDYEIVKKDEKNILEITTTPSWNNHGDIKFAVGFEDNFSGHSSYSVKGGYTMLGLNSYGGEWKNDIEIGRNKQLYTEYFQPLTPNQKFYVSSALLYNDRYEYIPLKSLGISLPGNLDVEMQRYGGKIGLGTYVNSYFELEFGVGAYDDTVKAELTGDKLHYDSRQLYSTLKIDDLDNLNFPNTGIRAKAQWLKEQEGLGSDYNFEQIYFNIEKPFTFGNHNITTFIKYGETYNKDGQTSLIEGFTLGGLFNLSGFSPYSLNDDNVFLGVIKYRYNLRDGGFFGTLNVPLYTGFSAELGNTWDYDENINFAKMHKSGAVYFAADTPLGPFYLAYGHSDSSESAFYLYLGERF
jgi:NTE family protein